MSRHIHAVQRYHRKGAHGKTEHMQKGERRIFNASFLTKFLSPLAKLWSVYGGIVDAMELKENFKRSFYLAQKEESMPTCTFLYKKSSK